MNLPGLAFAFASVPAFAASTPTLVLVAHNTTHRVEHLVESNRIDSHFVDRIYSVQVEKLTKMNLTDPAYRGTVMQVPDAEGKARTVEILLDDNANSVSFKETAGPDSRNAPDWPAEDAISLTEDSMHYVLDNASKPELKPFLTGLASVVLTQTEDVNHLLTAKVDMRSKDTKDVLEVLMKTDGTVTSANVIKP